MAQTGIVPSLLAAVQASLSVLLVIFYGAGAAHFKLLSSSSGKSISKVCVKLFLPALLFTKVGSELQLDNASRYLVIFVWALLCHIISFLIGIAAHLLLGFPDWITPGIMFNNTTSYPLLLIQSLDDTGILSSLITTNESTRDAIERAKSYFLVFATISSCLTFAVGPRLMDTEHSPDLHDYKKEAVQQEREDGVEDANGDADPEDGAHERTALLAASFRKASVSSNPGHRRAFGISVQRWLKLHPRVRWLLLFLYDFLNAPLLGAVLGTVVGLVPILHRAFFHHSSQGGIFTAWLTASLNSIGGLFVPLPVIVAGVSLYTSMRAKQSDNGSAAKTPWVATIFVLVVRFVLWPVFSIFIVYLFATKTEILGSDPMLWFTMMLMPTGPSAMKLIAMVEVSDVGEEEEMKIAKLLTVSYVVSPILAFTVVGALRASEAAMGK